MEIEIENVSKILPKDQELYSCFFDKESNLNHYGNNWAYIIQACRGTGGLGHKYFDGDHLLSIGLHNQHFVIVRPLGKNVTSLLEKLVFRLYKKSEKPVYIKHLLREQAEILKQRGFIDIKEYPWSKETPKDDDTFPQVVINLENFFNDLQTSKQAKIRLQCHKFLNGLPYEKLGPFRFQDYIPQKNNHQIQQAKDLIEKWSNGNKDFIDSYKNIIESPPINGFNYLVKLKDNSIVGFLILGKIGKESTACHANIFCYKEFNGLSEAGLVTGFSKLYEHGIKKVNLGGSETENLHKFKLKFSPEELKETYHMVFRPSYF